MAKRKFTPSAIQAAMERLKKYGFDTEAVNAGFEKVGITPSNSGSDNLDIMLSGNGSTFGVIVNRRSRPCRMEGCTGMCMCVRWCDNNKTTYPCSKGTSAVEQGVERIG